MACSILAVSPAEAQASEPQNPTTIEELLDNLGTLPEQKETLVLTDVDYLALTIWGEARGLSKRHMELVGSVIINRTKNKKYPRTIKEVVLQPGQFSVWRKSNPNYGKMLNLAYGRKAKDEKIYYQARQIAQKLIETGPITKAMSFHSKNGKHVYF